jgi:hypothetical protein
MKWPGQEQEPNQPTNQPLSCTGRQANLLRAVKVLMMMMMMMMDIYNLVITYRKQEEQEKEEEEEVLHMTD